MKANLGPVRELVKDAVGITALNLGSEPLMESTNTSNRETERAFLKLSW